MRVLLALGVCWFSVQFVYAGGSWGGEVGGSLRRFDQHRRWIDWVHRRPSFEQATLYHLYKEAGLGIEHEYLGFHVAWRTHRGKIVERWFTTGLVAAGDEHYFRRLFDEKSSPQLKKIRTYQDFSELEKTIVRINQLMCHHPARNQCMLGFVMMMTPLLGQPCSNAVRDILEALEGGVSH